MATITIDGLPPGLLLRLAAAAAASGRTLDGEIILRLALSAGSPGPLLASSGSQRPGGNETCRPERRWREPAGAAVGRGGWGGPA